MAGPKGSRTGRSQGCNHAERVRIERFLAAGASIKGAARKFAIDYHALRRHWRNHVSAEARSAYIAGAGASQACGKICGKGSRYCPNILKRLVHWRRRWKQNLRSLSTRSPQGRSRVTGLYQKRTHCGPEKSSPEGRAYLRRAKAA